jgi:hypothetical protein
MARGFRFKEAVMYVGEVVRRLEEALGLPVDVYRPSITPWS